MTACGDKIKVDTGEEAGKKVNTRPRFSPYRGVDKDAKTHVERTLCTLETYTNVVYKNFNL